MNKKLYDLMDWAEIEAIVYSEHDHPEEVLGPHKVRGGILIQAFLPGAKTVFLKNERDGKLYRMEEADEAGFFVLLLSGRKIPPYEYIARYEDGREWMGRDPYHYTALTEEGGWTLSAEEDGTPGYHRMGAHPVKVQGTGREARILRGNVPSGKKAGPVCWGTCFAVQVPGAMRVSVVGDFNGWDGRWHPMVRQGDSHLFFLFIPDVGQGDRYKFEVKWRNREIALISDPWAFGGEMPPSDASVVTGLAEYGWGDGEWMRARASCSFQERPMSIYEVYLGSWKRRKVTKDENDKDHIEEEYWNYRQIALELADYMGEMGYTHVELLPVAEHLAEESLGYEPTGYFSPTARYGKPEDFLFFVDCMHQKGIGVILDWVAVHKFRKEGAAASGFLVENALYWRDYFHVDGLRVTGMESVVRLDYGRQPGEWVPNKYGGNEDLDGVAFLKRLSSEFHSRGDGALLIAEDASAYPKVTEPVEAGGLGFDLKWNGEWTADFLDYMGLDPLFRKGSHANLINGMLYAYSERYVLMFSHNQVMDGKKTLLMKMPGEPGQQFGNYRVALGYLMSHPGKKLIFMGQEFARSKEWDGAADLSWKELEKEEHSRIRDYVKQWNRLYLAHPALYEQDYDERGFEWLSCLDADHSIISFLRRAKDGGEELMVVCNFTPVFYENFRLGVPYRGKFREIFNSDNTSFGGTGCINSSAVSSREVAWDGREHSVSINVPPLGICVFQCIPGEEEV